MQTHRGQPISSHLPLHDIWAVMRCCWNVLPRPKLNFTTKSDRDFVVACYDGNVDAVAFMLKSGRFDGNTSTSGQSALCAAAAGVRGGRPQSDSIKIDLIRLLCAHGADPNRFNWRKWSPLHYAILNGSAVVASELLDQGADVDALFDGATPLVLVACEDPRYPTPVSSSSVDDRPYGGVAVRLFMAEQTHTPLTPVARRKLMRLLLDRGASPHAIRNAHRVTADARAILRQYYSIVVHLNAFGTARTCPNPARLSAIDLVPTIASYVI